MPITKLRIARGLKANLPQPPNSFQPGAPIFALTLTNFSSAPGFLRPMESVTTPITAEATAIALTLNAGENVNAYQAGISDLDLRRAHHMLLLPLDTTNLSPEQAPASLAEFRRLVCARLTSLTCCLVNRMMEKYRFPGFLTRGIKRLQCRSAWVS